MFSKLRRRFCTECQPAKDNCQDGFLEAQQVNKTADAEYQRGRGKSIFLTEYQRFSGLIFLHGYLSNTSSVFMRNGFSLMKTNSRAIMTSGTSLNILPGSWAGSISNNL